MKGYKLQQILADSFVMPTIRADLEAVYRTLAKAADQRLVRLEGYAYEENMKNATRWAYARAQFDIKQWSGEKATRFNTAPPVSNTGLEHKIADIKRFLQSESSTKKGIQRTLQKRADTLNQRFGTNFRWDEVGKFFNSKLREKLDDSYGSKTVVKVVARLQEKKDDIVKAMKKAALQELDLSDQSMVDDMVRETLEKYGEDVITYLLGKK